MQLLQSLKSLFIRFVLLRDERDCLSLFTYTILDLCFQTIFPRLSKDIFEEGGRKPRKETFEHDASRVY